MAGSQDAASIIDEIIATRDRLSSDPSARTTLLNLSYALSASLETPSQTIQRAFWSHPLRSALIRTAVDLSIFTTLSNATRPLSAADLAVPKSADPVLLSRLLKHLSATHVIHETAPDAYVATSISNALTEQRFEGGVVYSHDVLGRAFFDSPAFFRENGWKNPSNPVDGPFQHAHGTKEHFFPWISTHEPYLESFNAFMGGYRAGKPFWADFYPVRESLLEGVEEEGKVLVDVGGGLGHDAAEAVGRFGELKGRAVLQDRTEVIEGIKDLDAGVEKTVHDFFTPQVVRGARAYYLHSVLHDWDDEKCIAILENLKPAMKKGYSKVLINDLVVPDEKADWSITSMDLLVMNAGAVKERTEKEWRTLVEQAGYKVTGVYTSDDPSAEKIIELELL